MRLLLVINRDAWAVGTLARLFLLDAPPDCEVRIVSIRDLSVNPRAFSQGLAWADLVHWMLHKHVAQAGDLVQSGRHVASLHHLDEDETNIEYLRSCGAVIVHAEMYRRRLLQKGWDEASVTCIPYPVDEAFFEFGQRRAAAVPVRRSGPFRIGFFSSADYESNRKGIDILPEILRRVSSGGEVCELVVTGLGWSEILKKQEFVGLPVTHRIVPSYFDMPALYGTLDAYLCTSRIEGGPMPVFEALASGVPVVSTSVGGVPDWLVDGVSYVGIPFNDAAAAADGLLNIARDPMKYRSYCIKACESFAGANSLHSWQTRLLQFYANVLAVPLPRGRTSDDGRRSSLRRKWRAWDRSYWAKECWRAGWRATALCFALESFVLDPVGEGLWRVPLRMLGIRRDEVVANR